MDKRVSVIHEPSNEVAEADDYLIQTTTNCAVWFDSLDPDVPLIDGDTYYIVIGDESTRYDLHKSTMLLGESSVRCDFFVR